MSRPFRACIGSLAVVVGLTGLARRAAGDPIPLAIVDPGFAVVVVPAEMSLKLTVEREAVAGDALGLAVGAILAGRRVSARAQETIPNVAVPLHVRSFSPSMASLIQQAGERSATFRRMVETINASDSYVYVDEGECPHDDRACLVNVTATGPYRYMFVHIATRQADWDLMGSIGHELRHAIEVIDNPSVTSVPTMRSLYGWIGKKTSRYRDLYETDAAIAAGDAIRDEVRSFIRRAKSQVSPSSSDGLAD